MKKERFFVVILSVFCIIAVIISYMQLIKVNNSDGMKFKKEYEELNGTTAYNDIKYSSLNINYKNPIKYVEYEELFDILQNKTGIIYLGFPKCPWCRTAIPVLFDIVNDYKIDNIYYMNILDERDSYTIEDDELHLEKNASDGYLKLLDILDEYLTDYVIELDDKTYEVGEKRIFAPSVIFVREGKILGIHVSTVASQENGFDSLTDDQYDELYSIYEDYITLMTSSTCDINSSC